MLDLDELERKIDAALAQETPESLTNWLMNKRASNVESYIGEGDYVPYHFSFLESKEEVKGQKPASISCDIYANTGSTQFAEAA